MEPTPTPTVAPSPPPGFFRAVVDAIRSRIVSGLLFMLPIVITFWIISWIYGTLRGVVLDPMARLVRRLLALESIEPPLWWQTYVSPIVAAILALMVLYFLGYFVRTRFSRWLDWLLLRVPFIAVVYKAVRNVFQSLQTTGGGMSFKRVVLVEFPHPGSRALSFVTKTLRDPASGETILCVWVLAGVMPPSGPVLFIKEKDVLDVPWSVNETLQIILSGGITSPALIPYAKGSPGSLIISGHESTTRAEELLPGHP